MSPVIKRLGAKVGSKPWMIAMAYQTNIQLLVEGPDPEPIKAVIVLIHDLWALLTGFEPTYRLWRA